MGAPHPKPEPATQRDAVRLESWKEIAAYLRRTIRTAQRWERDEGLPLHRHGHEQRDSVYAIAPELDAWLEERRHAAKRNSPSAAHPSKAPRWFLYSAILAVPVSVAAFAAYYWTASRPVVPFAARDWVVLADFQNETGESDLDHGLGLAFRVSLQQSHYANLLPESRAGAALRRMGASPDRKIDESVALEIAAREGAKGVILPGLSKVGGVYAVSARLIDVKTGETVAAYLEHAGGQDRVLEALGRLAARSRRGLGESLASIHHNEKPLPAVTTSSLDALRAFAEGLRVWKRGSYNRAVELFTAAVDRDPDFAMAHVELGAAFLSHVYNRLEEGKAHFARARQLRARVTEKEWLAIEARYHAALEHVPEASAAYRAYLASYPDDVDARGGFAYFLMRNGRAEEATRQYEEVLRILPGDSSALINLATSYKALNRAAEAIPYYEKAFALERTWLTIPNINREYGFALATTGNTAKASQVFSMAAANAPTKADGLRSLALLSMLEGKYRAAAFQLKEAAGAAEANHEGLIAARNRLFLAILSIGRADRGAALAELDRAALAIDRATNPGIWLPARVGMMYARAGATAKAVRVLAALASKADRQSASDRSELHLLEGEIALSKSEHESAIHAMAAARDDQDWPLTLAGLARSYDAAGRTDEAAATYDKLIAQLDSAAGWEPQQDTLAACARDAEIYLGRNDRDKARKAFERLAALWVEADSGLRLTVRVAHLRAALH
jgi:tetratricopeptide (TPR) repeat protein